MPLPAPLPIPTSVNLKVLDGGNVSRTSFLTLNLPTITPIKKLTKRLPNSPAYLGKRSKLRSFLN
jgi:hypothetical protein